MHRRRLTVLLVLPLVLAACGSGSSDAPQGASSASAPATDAAPVPLVVATTSIWADVVSNLACDGSAEVETLIPVGGDPHAFEPALGDRQRMEDAALVVANGLLLEEGLDQTLADVAAAGTPVFRVGDHVTTIAFGGEDDDHGHGGEDDDHGHGGEDDHGHGEEDDHGHGGEDDGHHHDGDDPHIWQDPMTVLPALGPLADALIASGVEEETVRRCAAAYEAELRALDTEVEAILAVVPEERRVLITNHDSLGYFAARYGFEVLGSVIPSSSSLAEANPAQMEALTAAIREHGVTAIFGETQHSAAALDALAGEVGDVEVITLYTDSLGAEGTGAETYLGLLRTNAQLIAGGLG